jgi:hypothetical protein
MSDVAELEQGYRRLVRWYPSAFLGEHETEIVSVLLAGARDGQCRPSLIDRLDLLRGAIGMRLRPRISRFDRSAFAVARLMYVAVFVQAVLLVTIVVTIGGLRANIVGRNPAFTNAQWQAEVDDQLRPLVIAALVALVLGALMAWSNGRGHGWARVAFVALFALNTESLLNGLNSGSAVYARPDLAVGLVLWMVEFATVVLLFDQVRRTVTRVALRGRGSAT